MWEIVGAFFAAPVALGLLFQFMRLFVSPEYHRAKEKKGWL